MARYLALNSLAGAKRTSALVVELTTSGRFDSTYVSSAITTGTVAADYFEVGGGTFLNGSTSLSGTVWLRFDWYVGTVSTSAPPLTLLNGTTNAYRITCTNAGTGVMQFQYWNSTTSAWVNWGATFTIANGTRYTIVVQLVPGTSFKLYQGGTQVTSDGGTTPTSAQSAFNIGRCSGNAAAFSQIMWADYDIRDAHLLPATFNGNSATNTGGTGAYTDINETVLDESTAEVVATVGNKMGQTHASITVPSGLGIAALVLNGRGRVSGGVVTDGKLGVRSGGTNYSSTGRVYNGGYEPRGAMWESDPNGGGAWSQTSFNSAETYIEAA